MNTERFLKSEKLMEDIFINRKEGTPDKSEFESKSDYLVSAIMTELLIGANKLTEGQIHNLAQHMPEVFNEVVLNRWDGIICYFKNDLDKSSDYFKIALNKAKSCDSEKWLIRDILLDIRTVEITRMNFDNILQTEIIDNLQSNLESMKDWNYHPRINIKLFSAMTALSEAQFQYVTDSPFTLRMGGNLPKALEYLSSALINAICYGSLTYIHIIRKQLAYLLFHYSKIYAYPRLTLQSLKIFVLEHEVSIVEKILEAEWERIYPIVVNDAAALLSHPIELAELPQEKVMQCILINKLGPYIADEHINEIQSFLKGCLQHHFSMVTTIDVKRNGIRALQSLGARLNLNELLIIIIDSLNDNQLVIREILNLLYQINWTGAKRNTIERIVEKLFSMREQFLTRDSFFGILANIQQAYPDLLANINNALYEEWEKSRSIDISWYFALLDNVLSKQQIETIATDLIQRIGKTNGQYVKGSAVGFGGYSLFYILSSYASKCTVIIKEQTIQVYKGVLINRYQTLTNKIDCIKSIIATVVNSNNSMSLVGKQINDIIQENYSEVLLCRTDALLERSYIESLELAIYELSVYVGKHQKIDQIMTKCIEYGTHTFMTVREGALNVVRAMVNSTVKYPKENLRQYLFSKTFDGWYKIRGDAFKLLTEVSQGNKLWENICLNRLKEHLEDIDSYVRSSAICSVEQSLIKKRRNKEYRTILKHALRDPHYQLREQAREIYNKVYGQSDA